MVQDNQTAADTIRYWSKFLPFPGADGAGTADAPDAGKMTMIAPHVQAAFLKVLIDQQKALFGFLQQRCEEDMKYAERLGSVSSLAELISANIDFYREAALQYAAQASRAAEISSQSTIEVAHDLEQERAGMLSAVEQVVEQARKAA